MNPPTDPLTTIAFGFAAAFGASFGKSLAAPLVGGMLDLIRQHLKQRRHSPGRRADRQHKARHPK